MPIPPGRSEHFERIPLPHCKKCGHQVAVAETKRDVLRHMIEIKALCHGEVETVKLTEEDLIHGAWDGTVFAGKAKPE